MPQDEQLDLLQTLLNVYLAETEKQYDGNEEGLQEVEREIYYKLREAVQKFVERARELLRENQPVSLEFIDTGFAIRFQDSTVIPFITEGEVEATGGVDGSIPISKPDVSRDRGMASSPSWDITKDKDKT